MYKNKEYYRLMKTLPLEKCPEGVTGKVIQSSGILIQKNSRKDMISRVHSYCYGIACVITFILILTAINMGISNGANANQEKLATNTVTVINQISDNFRVAYILHERSNI